LHCRFWATVCKTVRPMLSDRCLSVCLSVLSVLSVTFVHCGQTVGRIKMKLGMRVGLGPNHIVLDGDPAPPPPKRHSPPPIFGPYLLRPNGCMDQDVTWDGGRPPPRRLHVRWGPSTPPQKGAEPSSPIFGPFLLCQTAGCIKMPLGMDVDLSPGDFIRWRPSLPSPKGGTATPKKFWPMFIVAKRLHG